MIHAFVLVVLLGDNVISNDMYFYDIDRCNYFASRTVKNYGNYRHEFMMPKEHRRTAYCKPVKVDENYPFLYE